MKYILAVIIFTLSQQLNAQINDNKIQTIVKGGKIYLVHTIQRGETLYNISKRYEIPYDSLVKANPQILPTSLVIGSSIHIPYNKQTSTDKNQAEPDKKEIYHIVKQGETVYRISQMYNVKLEHIYKLNPEAQNGIKPEQKILISEDKSAVTKVIEPSPSYHIVQEKETLHFITKKYGITLEQLKRLNPDIKENNLQVGEKIIISANHTETDKNNVVSVKTEQVKEQYHRVQPKETLYGISRKYGITVEQLRNNNPDLKTRELQTDEMLNIPFVETAENKAYISINNIKDTINTEQPCPCITQDNNKTIKVGLMLPFYSNINDTLTPIGSIPQLFSRSKQFVEFYQGTLMALNNLKNNGLKAELHVFDTQNNPAIVQDICKSDDFKSLDLIIGPAFSKNIEIVSKEAMKYNIPLVSPLSTDEKFLLSNENAFMVSPSQKIQDTESIKFLNKIKGNSYVVIFDGTRTDSTFIPQLKQQIFQQYSPSDTVKNHKYIEFSYINGMEEQLIELFDSIDSVVVIIPSNDKAFVSNIVARLNTLTNKKQLLLFGQPRWSKFDNIKLEFFHNLNTHLFTLSYPNYNNQNVKDFVSQYRQFYGTEPQARAFEGYDISKYFIEAVHLYGKDFRCCLNKYTHQLLHTVLDMKQIQQGSGYINHHMYLVHYMKNFERSIKTFE